VVAPLGAQRVGARGRVAKKLSHPINTEIVVRRTPRGLRQYDTRAKPSCTNSRNHNGWIEHRDSPARGRGWRLHPSELKARSRGQLV